LAEIAARFQVTVELSVFHTEKQGCKRCIFGAKTALRRENLRTALKVLRKSAVPSAENSQTSRIKSILYFFIDN
jgi:hypothetical protein